jgi:excisionase family DNA binding protein
MNKSDAPLHLERIGLTAEEAAAIIGVAAKTVRAEIRAGRFPHYQIGERTLIGRQALEAWLTHECLASVQMQDQPASDRTADAVRRFQRRRSAV